MALAKRIIPCLDVDRGRVVKGVNFVGIRDAGDPVEIARRYNEEGADEITFLDITASHEERDTTVHTVEQIACEVSSPSPSAAESGPFRIFAPCSMRVLTRSALTRRRFMNLNWYAMLPRALAPNASL